MSNITNGDSKPSRTRYTNGSSRPLYNDDAYYSDFDSPAEEPTGVVMRVGKDYQAEVPDVNKESYGTKCEALLVWQPFIQKLNHAQVDEFCRVAREQHKYSEEQALGMLFWHKHDVDKALSDLANFAPFPDEWCSEDKVLFEQAFSCYGKSFHRIREMLPDKSIAALVKYYYGWKKSRTRTSLMDKHVKQVPSSDVISDLSSQSDSDGSNKGEPCDNCNSTSTTWKLSRLCKLCRNFYENTGKMRPFSLYKTKEDTSLMPQRYNPTKSRKRPPKGIYMNAADLMQLATGGDEQNNATLEKISLELCTLRTQVQTNKQHISLLKGDVLEAVTEFKPADNIQMKPTSKWTQDELLIAVQGVRQYGRNYHSISKLLGTKTPTQVKSFFSSYKRKYNLDEALAEYEADKKGTDVNPFGIEQINMEEDYLDDDHDDSLPTPLNPTPVKANSPSPKFPTSKVKSSSPSTKGRSSPLTTNKGRSSPKIKTIKTSTIKS